MLLRRSFHVSSFTREKLSNIKLIKLLREEIQAPLNIVKTAVAEAQPAGDYDAALQLLKQAMTRRGEKLVAKSVGRQATEGWVIAARSQCGKAASLSILNCETDFVAKSDGVVALAQSVGRALADKAAQGETSGDDLAPVEQSTIDGLTVDGQPLSQKLTESISVFGESIRINRAMTALLGARKGQVLGIHCHGAPATNNPTKDVYLGRMGALVRLTQSAGMDAAVSQLQADEIAREIVAQNPDGLEEFWSLDKVGDKEARTVRQWAGDDVTIEAWARWERDQS
ncbi:elongation factor TS-domain-containing protein [Protomyces lactucae-debilis]|uniref:Elongation factor Ts, mitochondrial n=1 Tax=Protomyces lactucae-debilis TaxID=2754530 RepID=A0A1Y2FF41_PROLT|nr:elongation factor TS-domain-containing protein [Protomyces lactucae-debilis]ORY81445.1 elongation factor TS-domain-containing protein [Protomyces lactucae-debilis]